MLAQANAIRIPLAAESVHCVTTSPPFWGLRAYQGQQSFAWPGGSFAPWPGLPKCVEIPGPDENELTQCQHNFQIMGKSTTRIRHGAIGGLHAGRSVNKLSRNILLNPNTGACCLKCGAWRGGLGQEPQPEMFIFHILLVMREVRRVLRPDSVCYFDIGDCYASNGKGSNVGQRSSTLRGRGINQGSMPLKMDKFSLILPKGNLVGIPAMLLKALQADGWIVRNDLVWHKVAPMPESLNGTRYEAAPCGCLQYEGKRNETLTVGKQRLNNGDLTSGKTVSDHADPDCPDCGGTGRVGEPELRRGSWRHTRAHEFVFMLTKQMGYWSDKEAVKEKVKESSLIRSQSGWHGQKDNGRSEPDNTDKMGTRWASPSGRNPRSVLSAENDFVLGAWLAENAPVLLAEYLEQARNSPSVMSPAPSAYSGNHYATYPPGLIQPFILASCPARCCPVCGAGWAPVVEIPEGRPRGSYHDHSQDGIEYGRRQGGKGPANLSGDQQLYVTGYRPTCAHPHTEQEALPGIVLDPFCGSGTTGLVARELGRRFVGLDVSLPYLRDQAMGRAEVYTLPLMAV